MLQNPCKTLGFKKNMVYKIPPGGGGGKPYPASGLILVLWQYWVLVKSRIPLKMVLGGVRIAALSISSHEQTQ